MSEIFSNMGHTNHIHFVGVGGVGMCGIAEVLCQQGYNVSGSDLNASEVTRYLSTLGVTIHHGHRVDNINGCDVVVQSTAIPADNAEISAARAKGIPIVPRAQMLAELMRFKRGIAIAGTHGKTTTTSLVSTLLARGGLDPSYVIGGKLQDHGSNAKRGNSPYIVVEADESDASFLLLNPMIAVVTNIDQDHMATYDHDPKRLRQAFIDFLNRLPFYGLAVVCVDDPLIADILPEIQCQLLTYGFDEKADVRASDWQQLGLQNHFQATLPSSPKLSVAMPLPGRHNAMNALAALAVGQALGVRPQVMVDALASFGGIGRRFQVRGDICCGQRQVTVIDDYGHHPREITPTLEAVRQVWPQRRLVHVFQPHRYSRTQSLFDAFCQALTGANLLILVDIYGAGEAAIAGVTHEALAAKIRGLSSQSPQVYCCSLSDLPMLLDDYLANDDVVLFQGAGSIASATNDFITSQRVEHA